MYFNLDKIPAGKCLYTVHVTLDPQGTPRSEMSADQVDMIAPASSGKQRLLETGKENVGGANVGEYIWQTYGQTARVIGIVNQSDGYVVYDAFKAGDETGTDDM